MIVQKINVVKLLITEIKSLDPVSVFIEEHPPSGGKITFECYGESWTYFWGSIGEKTFEEFFCGCDNSYLSGKFAPQLDSEVDDPDGLPEYAREHILSERRKRWLNKKDAREQWEKCEFLTMDDNIKLQEIFGDEWWRHCCPKQPNHKYGYLGRILDAVKEAIKQGDQ